MIGIRQDYLRAGFCQFLRGPCVASPYTSSVASCDKMHISYARATGARCDQWGPPRPIDLAAVCGISSRRGYLVCNRQARLYW